MYTYRKKPKTPKEKLLFEIEQLIYYSENPIAIRKLEIVKEKTETIL